MRNIIDAANRFRQAGTRPRDTLAGRLRSTVQVPPSDRALMAERFGLIAAQIATDDPRRGAKRIFDVAWAGNKWDKRKRLIRLPGEPPSDPSEYGSYEASGSTWAAFASAAAQLVSGSNAINEQERLLRKVLRGTSLLPTEAPISHDPRGARSLFTELAKRISERIARETAIQQLWDALRTTPFEVDELYQAPDPVTDLEVAARAVDPLMQRRRGGFPWSYFFSTRAERPASTNWSYPLVRVGSFAQRIRGAVFVVPAELEDCFSGFGFGTEREHANSEEAICQWIDSLGEAFLKARYHDSRGYGWAVRDFERTKTVYMQACPRASGDIGIWLTVHEPFIDNFIPVLRGCDVAAEALAIEHRVQSGEPFEPEECFRFQVARRSNGAACIPYELAIIEWPAALDELRVKHGERKLLGIVDTDDLIHFDAAGGDRTPRWMGEPPDPYAPPRSEDPDETSSEDESYALPDSLIEGPCGWLDDEDNADVSELLFAVPPNTRFISAIAGDEMDHLPCHPDSLGAALIRNALALPEDRLSALFCAEADELARVGLNYQQAMVDNLRQRLIDG